MAQVEQAVSKQVLRVAVTDLQQVLNGGTLQFLGQNVPLLGLRNSRAIVQGTIASLPQDSPLVPALRQVVNFADLAIDGLGFATPVLGSIGIAADRADDPAGRARPRRPATYAAAIAVIVSLMFVGCCSPPGCSRSSAPSTPTRVWCADWSRRAGCCRRRSCCPPRAPPR